MSSDANVTEPCDDKMALCLRESCQIDEYSKLSRATQKLDCQKLKECIRNITAYIESAPNGLLEDRSSKPPILELTEDTNRLTKCLEYLNEQRNSLRVNVENRTEDIETQLQEDTFETVKPLYQLLSYLYPVEFQTDANPNILKGHIRRSEGTQRPFSLDISAHSHHFISNHLWDLISE